MATYKQLVVIRILAKNRCPMYGMEIIDKSDGLLGRWGIYVLLAAMEDAGLVSSFLEETREDYPGLPRRLYRLEDAGKRVLSEPEQKIMAMA